MNKKCFITLSLGSMLLLGASCNKQLTALSSDNFNVNPSPLEVEGRMVPATISQVRSGAHGIEGENR